MSGFRQGAPVAAADRERAGLLDHRLAEQERVTDAYVCKLLPLTYPTPDIAETAAAKGRGLADVPRSPLLNQPAAPVFWPREVPEPTRAR